MRKTTKAITGLVFLFFLASQGQAMLNPAAVYCSDMGYEYVTEKTAAGMTGMCKFPDGSKCEAWAFLKNKCGTAYSYCATKGLSQRAGTGSECPEEFMVEQCTLCILRNGTAVEATKLMELSFKEGLCGDGACVLGETAETCPQDCPTTTTTKATTTTTSTTTTTTSTTSTTVPEPPKGGLMDYLIYVVILAVVLIAAFLAYRKISEKKIEKQREEYLKWKEETKEA